MEKFDHIDKSKFEYFFGMESGHVLDLSERAFQKLVNDTVGLDIYDEKYQQGSVASLLRGFWQMESNYNIGRLLEGILKYWFSLAKAEEYEFDLTEEPTLLHKELLEIVEKLKSEKPVENIDAIQPNSDDITFTILAESIRETIEKNEPEKALDRLHTFTIKYIRQLCNNHKVVYNKETPLHTLFGGYFKSIDKKGLIESEMTKRILKSSISILEAFNVVRNNQSFAHDNKILNYHESKLISSNVASLIHFLESFEKSKIEK